MTETKAIRPPVRNVNDRIGNASLETLPDPPAKPTRPTSLAEAACWLLKPFAQKDISLKPTALDDVAHQFILAERHTRDANTGLLYHAWDERRQQRWVNPATGCSPHFWGRAMGWYAMALADALDFFPAEHPRREEIVAIFGRLAEAAAQAQDTATGLWYQVLDKGGRAGNYLEASASCMFAYALARGARMGYVPARYLAAAARSSCRLAAMSAARCSCAARLPCTSTPARHCWAAKTRPTTRSSRDAARAARSRPTRR